MGILQTVLTITLVTAGGISPSLAASQQALGSDYESFTDSKSCLSSVQCTVSFPAIPAGKTIKVSSVVCSVFAPGAGPISLLFGPTATAFSTSFIKTTFFDLTFQKDVVGSTYKYFTFRSDLPILLGPGRFPTVGYGTDVSGSITIKCALAGIVK